MLHCNEAYTSTQREENINFFKTSYTYLCYLAQILLVESYQESILKEP